MDAVHSQNIACAWRIQSRTRSNFQNTRLARSLEIGLESFPRSSQSYYHQCCSRPTKFVHSQLLTVVENHPYNLENTVGTVPLMSTSVLLFLTQASSPLLPFSTPRPLCFHPPTLISAGLSPQVLTQVMPASS